MQVQKPDPALKKFFAQNGMGTSMDLFYELPYRIGKRYGKFAVEVNDLGIIQWKSSSMSYSVDSSYHYDGINVNDIFNSHGAFPSLNIDTIIKKHTSFERKQYITNLPFTLHIHTQAWHGKYVLFEKGISFLFNSSAKPYYYIKTYYYNKKQNIGFACTIGYGAYGRFNAGLEAKINFSKHYSILFADNYLLPGTSQSACGMGMYLKLTRRF